MIRTAKTLLLLAMLTLLNSSQSSAGVVLMLGQLTSGNGVLGAIPPTTSFSLSLDFTDDGAGFGTINSGQFNSAPGSISIASGDILLVDNGVNDQALFSINTSSPDGALSVTFNGNGFTNNQITTENLVSIINASGPTTISANFGVGGNYTGSVISAVPEPGSALLLGATGLALTFARSRNRRPCASL